MKHTLLIIDDDKLIINTLRKRFATWDINVYAASTPLEARDLMVSITPDAVLLDVLLTKDDGSQSMIDYMKSHESLAYIPILVLTNLDKPALKELLLSQGVKEYIIKGSIGLEELYKKVLGYLEPEESVI